MGMPRRVAGSIMVRTVRTAADRIRRTKPDAGRSRSAVSSATVNERTQWWGDRTVKELLTEALQILKGTDANDTRTRARGRRAHARVLAMINFADETAKLSREQRINNLLMLARTDHEDAEWALSEARRMLSESDF